ncbi:hypothetical protein AAFF_G00257980 [Aldrovandia affinis]|uniref:Uncharacterized protein n=1 Tax=Aldrovandia affinis TaxID=143900 RepID=A0AAD7ST54_9TELE|nr:hypothetical protein AAFF_G00257980 [Aldrovandia affinis]
MASSKSSQTTRNIVIAFLALWSVISLIIIVVWATSPDMKSASQCRAELQALTEKLEGAKVVWTKDRRALEDLVRQGWANQTAQLEEIGALTATLQETNSSLSFCQQESAILYGNITALEKEIEEHEKMAANLTSENFLQKDTIELLQLNLNQTAHQFESSEALRSSAVSQQKAAESKTKACESTKHYIQKQLQRCKNDDPACICSHLEYVAESFPAVGICIPVEHCSTEWQDDALSIWT